MDQHTIAIVNLVKPSFFTNKKESHITCTCGFATLFVEQDVNQYEAETHAASHVPIGIIKEV